MPTEIDVEAADGVVEVAEDEPQCGHDAELVERNLHEVLLVDEVAEKYLKADAGHLEDVGTPVDAGQHRDHRKDGHERQAEEVVEPRRGDKLALCHSFQQWRCLGLDVVACNDALTQFGLQTGYHIAVLEHREEVVQAGDGHDGCKLESPPNKHLHGHERIAYPGGKGGHKHDKCGDVRIDDVGEGQALAMAAYHPYLPQREGQQHWREDEVQEAVGHKHYAQHDDQRRQEHQWRIDEHGMAHLATFQADED